MADPRQCVPSQWPGARPLAAGDVLSCELSTTWGVDYPGQLLRTFTVAADPTPLYVELHAVADAALDRIESVLRPGATARRSSRPQRSSRSPASRRSTTWCTAWAGATSRRSSAPAAARSSPCRRSPAQPGMTVVVQPNVDHPDRRAGVQTGALFVITATGCERLHHFPRGLGRID